MNLKELREMVNLMNENNITELELEREGVKIKLKKGYQENFAPVVSMTHPGVQSVSSPPVAPPKGEEPSPPTKSANIKEINAPMVGTFYRAPSPDSPPYVEVGQVVEEGQVVCIVEAMKLMNEIKSEFRGKIVDIPIDNAQPVEFGQTLFVLEPV